MSPQRGKQSEIWAQVGFYTSLGFIIPAGAVIGFALGSLLDRWIHTGHVFALIFGFLGAAGGLVEILQILTRAEKRADGNNQDGGPKS
ncbi:MAG TPA: AtpZ/AtpI family protein [Terriglobia bacterium]|nr:AtpZ/AtpI family protein [Terriglobia bacterium]